MSEESQLKKKTAGGLLWGGIGHGSMQLLNLLFGIFLSRLLSPADYGVIGALTLFSAMAGIFTESGFTLAIVNCRQVDSRHYNSVFWFNVVVGLAFYFILYLLAPAIARFYHDEVMIPLSRFLFLSFVLGGFATAPSAFFFRNMMVKERSQNQMAAIAVSGTVGVVCAASGWGAWGIAMQTVLYSLTNCVLMWVRCPWRPTFSFDWSILRSLLPFSVRQMFTSLFTHINNNFFAAMLARYYTKAETGFYTQGNKWTTMGYATITGMLGSVAQPVLRQSASDGIDRVKRVFRKLLRFTAFVSFPAMFGLAIIAREVIVLTITDKWLPCVPVMQILCIWGAFSPISTLYANLFNSLLRPGVYMWNTIALGVAQLACLFLSYPYGLTTMLWAYTALNVAWLFVWEFFAYKAIGLSPAEVLADILPYILTSAVAMWAAVYVASFFINPLATAAIKIIVAAAVYSLILWRLDSVIFRECLNYVIHRKNAE